MAELLSGLPLTRLPPAGHYGAATAGVRMRVLDRCALATVSAGREKTAMATEACAAHFGFALIDRPCVSGNGSIAFLGIGPGRWLAVGHQDEPFLKQLTEGFDATAAICNQSDGYIVFAVDGPAIRDCLSKGPSIDFSSVAFKPGDVATTTMAHIGMIIWRPTETNEFRIAVPSSFAPSFVRLFLASAAEFGLDFA